MTILRVSTDPTDGSPHRVPDAQCTKRASCGRLCVDGGLAPKSVCAFSRADAATCAQPIATIGNPRRRRVDPSKVVAAHGPNKTMRKRNATSPRKTKPVAPVQKPECTKPFRATLPERSTKSSINLHFVRHPGTIVSRNVVAQQCGC